MKEGESSEKHKEVQELWEEIMKREKSDHSEAHDEEHKDYEEEVMRDDEQEKEEE